VRYAKPRTFGGTRGGHPRKQIYYNQGTTNLFEHNAQVHPHMLQRENKVEERLPKKVALHDIQRRNILRKHKNNYKMKSSIKNNNTFDISLDDW
jgi:hypothetical protein